MNVKLFFGSILLLFILPFITPLTSAFTANQEITFRVSTPNTRYTLGSSLTFYRTQINSTHLWLDQSYTARYYTRYCLMPSTSNVNWTINTWFATANSSARLTLTAPTSSNVKFGFHSPNLLDRPTVSGAAGQTWFPSNLTLVISANTATSATITISVSVSETRESNITPENYEVTITDMEGCGNWVFSEESYYTFQAKYWDGNGYADLDTCQIGFTDGDAWINASYDRSANEYTLFSGSDKVRLQSGTATSLDANLLQVTFRIYFESTILDADNVDIYLRCNDTQGAVDGWEIVASDYFHIYALGGHATYRSNGDAGHIAGGDVFDLYAESNTSGSWVEANLTFRNLQHFKLLPKMIFNTSALNFNLYYTLHYCVDDQWHQGLTLRLNPWTTETGSFRHLAIHCYTQYGISAIHGGYFKAEDIYIYHSLNASEISTARFWIDLWFNKVNASTTMGTRINAYYYPMTDSSAWWLQWLTGSNWGINETVPKAFMGFNDILLTNGSIISTKQIDFVRVQMFLAASVIGGPTYQRIEVTDHDVFDLTIGPEPFTGIQTPVFDETKVPIMPQGGFLGTLASMFMNGLTNLADFLGPHMLNFWNLFVGFLDSIAAYLGYPGAFSTMISWISSFWTWMVSSITYLITLLTTIFTTVLSPTISKFLNLLSSVFTQWVNMLQTLFDFLDGTFTAGINVYSDLNIATWIQVFAILYPLYLLILWETKGMTAVIAQLTFIKDIVFTLAHFFLAVAQWFIALIGRIIESVPIAE